jgi:hypothetical protein
VENSIFRFLVKLQTPQFPRQTRIKNNHENSLLLTMPSLVSSNAKADALIAPVEGLDVPPACRPEHITTLIESVNRYNPESLEVLEEYLAQQCSDGTFDCLADLAILKL